MTLRLTNGRQASTPILLPFDLVLDANGRRRLRSKAWEENAERGQVLAKEGDIGNELLLLLEGVIKLWKSLPDGRQVIVAFRAAGDLVSLHRCDTPWRATAQAVTQCRVIRIRWDELDRLANHAPALERALLDLVSDEVATLQDRLLTLSRKTTEERLASFLLEFSLPSAAPSSFNREVRLPMRRPEIADYLGMTTESVSREFTRFKRQRLIAMPRPSCVVILNKSVLESLALGRMNLDSRPASSVHRDGRPDEPRSPAAASNGKA